MEKRREGAKECDDDDERSEGGEGRREEGRRGEERRGKGREVEERREEKSQVNVFSCKISRAT